MQELDGHCICLLLLCMYFFSLVAWTSAFVVAKGKRIRIVFQIDSLSITLQENSSIRRYNRRTLEKACTSMPFDELYDKNTWILFVTKKIKNNKK
jgi:hypothetical protein